MPEVTVPTGSDPGFVHPLDILERVAEEEGWDYERNDGDSSSIKCQGAHLSYLLEFTWMEEIEVLVVAAPYELKVPAHRLGEFKELLRLINVELWVGHFDYWESEGVTLFRYSLLIPADTELSYGQCQAMVAQTVGQWDFYLPAFHQVIWVNTTAKEAVKAVQFITEGEA